MFSMFSTVTRGGRWLVCALGLACAGLAHAQFASSTQPELNQKAAGGFSVSGNAVIPWVDSTMGPGGAVGPTPVPASCPAAARWGMQYGGSIVACLFPDQRCDGDEAPVNVSWRQYATRTQYEPQGCCVKEWHTYTYDCNCTTHTDVNGNTSTSCQQCSGQYATAKLQGCNVTKQFFSDCSGTVHHKWSKVLYQSRFSQSPTSCLGRDAAGKPTEYQGTTCYDEVLRDTVQNPPSIQSSTNSTGGTVGTAHFSCVGNNQWAEWPSPERNQCPLGTYDWDEGDFIGRDGPWDC
jgi:hypothetical protein